MPDDKMIRCMYAQFVMMSKPGDPLLGRADDEFGADPSIRFAGCVEEFETHALRDLKAVLSPSGALTRGACCSVGLSFSCFMCFVVHVRSLFCHHL